MAMLSLLAVLLQAIDKALEAPAARKRVMKAANELGMKGDEEISFVEELDLALPAHEARHLKANPEFIRRLVQGRKFRKDLREAGIA